MKIRVLTVASAEMTEAMAWYRQRSPRAAETLWLKIQKAQHSIRLFPLAAPTIARGARRHVLSGYPYDLIYSVLPDEILVLAFAHHSRRPGYWLSRFRQLN